MADCVIVGGGHAALAIAAKLRALDPDRGITIVSNELAAPYHRPPLSKAYMGGRSELEQILLRPESWFEANRVALMRGVAVEAIDRAAKQLKLSSGADLAYDALVLATGARPRRLPAAIGGHLPGVYVMRDLVDADALKAEMVAGRRMVVIGGGYIGLEAASEAQKHGVEVTVLEAADRILKRVASAETADDIRTLHLSHGVRIREGVSLTRIIEQDGRAAGVELASGEIIPADCVLTGIGVDPNVELAAAAGLTVGNGIHVDEGMRTSDPAIFAAGDVAAFPHELGRIRLESVQNANDQGAVIAANLTGADVRYQPVPWFWSDQYDMKLQIAGLSTGYDAVVTRPGIREGSRSHFYFKGERFLAVDCLNDAAVFVTMRKLLEMGRQITKAQAADPALILKSLIA